ncbi:XRE family transcriptional regulator [Brevibacillus borstelensis]|jgi:transcriptional regulator with XRE-family HTH domain|uniref:helix-turn-helix domain-containing protein n=1 Tax=Brevibacillus borstelensis TaxID=45462 RepID=UPI000F074A25|nr:helix-turn-helix transcriptional regulator [Brevibacillus borstelensis]MED1881192.1 helix-turn-helix transcriptional regulator [Brevibacillus borstelensis]RNB62796.1 XRE family transcriptional regulator [Brevibacillus borstelensis]GED55137.1 hypothetical protein BBO01nite_43780 [Brevibacillus borstelensis]
MTDSKKLLGERLRTAREKKGLKQNRVALSLGIHNSTLAKYESGEREVDLDTLNKLAEIYEVSVNYLITGNYDDLLSTSDKKDKPDELTTIMYHKWDQLDERRRKQALKLIEILEQEADEENSKD